MSVSRKGRPEEILSELKSADISWLKGDATNIESFREQLPAKADVVIDLVGTATICTYSRAYHIFIIQTFNALAKLWVHSFF